MEGFPHCAGAEGVSLNATSPEAAVLFTCQDCLQQQTVGAGDALAAQTVDSSPLCRGTETSERIWRRRERDRERKRIMRMQESPEETIVRRQKDALRKFKRRLEESPEQTVRRRAKDRERARMARARENAEQAAARREKNRIRRRLLRGKLLDGLKALCPEVENLTPTMKQEPAVMSLAIKPNTDGVVFSAQMSESS